MYLYDYKSQFSPDEILIYLRKSRSDDPTLSVEEVLEKHETVLDEWAEKNLGAKIPDENKFREVVSGETLKERPEINIVLRMVESPKYKAIAVVEPQRLTRGDLEDIGRLMKLLKYTNTYIITPQRVYDLRDDYDWDAFERELKRGNDYLEYTKKILNRGRLLSVSQGNYIASIPPYGYDKCWVMDGRRKCPTLKENKEQADIVRMIFDMYVNKDMGRNNICNKLDSLGIAPPKGTHWSPPALKDMLGNIHYIGKVKWNWRKTNTIVEDGVLIKTRPKSQIGEYLIYEGRHEGIIPEELYNAAQEKQGKNHRAKPTTKIRNPLASLLFCHCGRAMSLRFFKRDDGTDKTAPRLSCDGQIHCNTGSCTFDEVVERVGAIIEQTIEDFEMTLKNSDEATVKMHEQLIRTLEKKLKDLRARELSQWEAQADPDPGKRMPQQVFQQLNAKLQFEKEETQQALRKANELMPKPSEYNEKIAKFKVALEALRNPNIDAQEKNRLLKTCIERIEYNRERPQRLKRDPNEKKGTTLSIGGNWTNPPIELKINLKV